MWIYIWNRITCTNTNKNNNNNNNNGKNINNEICTCVWWYIVLFGIQRNATTSCFASYAVTCRFTTTTILFYVNYHCCFQFVCKCKILFLVVYNVFWWSDPIQDVIINSLRLLCQLHPLSVCFQLHAYTDLWRQRIASGFSFYLN